MHSDNQLYYVAKHTQGGAAFQHVTENGTVAEEVVSTVRAAQTVGLQKVLDSCLNEKHI